MSTTVSDYRPISLTPGVEPTTEGTGLTTTHYLSSSKIRSFNGKPSKIGGWDAIDFDNGNTISGVARAYFSTILNGSALSIAGTHTRLYALYGTTLTNITPVVVSTTAAANSLDTLYGTLANNPITTVSGSKTITIADTSASRLVAGENVTLSGAADTGGIGAAEINTTHIVRSISGSTFTVTVATTAATSSVSGGGASVVRATGLIQLTKSSHGLSNGDRIKVAAAATTGGVTDTVINAEHIIRNVAANTLDFMTTGTATSSVSGGGGASTTYRKQIAAGAQNETTGQGYGMGLYGMGLYGTALVSANTIAPARSWTICSERFGSVMLMTAGEQTGLYEWDGVTTLAPVLVSGAPAAINYAFVSDNIVVTFGASGVENRISASDQGDRTNWTSSSTNSVFTDDIEGAGRLISHLNVGGVNLIFTKQRTYTFRKIPRDSGVWEIKLKDPAIGIIGQNARVVVNGIGYWMGEFNFYHWRGGNIEIVPSNTKKQSTILKYVFDNINRAQTSKFFAWHNEKYNEVWWHYCSSTANEPDRVARLCLQDMSWWPDTMDRTCAEYPNITNQYPRLINSTGTMYQHEYGHNDDGAAMSWSLQGSDLTWGKKNASVVAIVPDSLQYGSITTNLEARAFPQSSTTTYDSDFTVTATTDRIPVAISGRFWRYTWSGSAVDQYWTMGQWFEQLQDGAGA